MDNKRRQRRHRDDESGRANASKCGLGLRLIPRKKFLLLSGGPFLRRLPAGARRLHDRGGVITTESCLACALYTTARTAAGTDTGPCERPEVRIDNADHDSRPGPAAAPFPLVAPESSGACRIAPILSARTDTRKRTEIPATHPSPCVRLIIVDPDAKLMVTGLVNGKGDSC